MGGEKKLEAMQEELKLLKGELKQSLASVRDYLLNMELPASEFSNILDALDGGDSQKVTMSGSLGTPVENKPVEEIQEEIVEPEMPADNENLIDVEEPAVDESGEVTEERLAAPEEKPGAEDMVAPDEPAGEELPELPDEPEEALGTESGLPLENDQTIDRVPDEVSLATPKVNMLANLITWVSKAKKEIGYDQLPMFLEVYGISGHLSPELKEIILNLAEITDEKPEVVKDPQVWSQAMLSLHGILTGGDAPLHPVLPFLTETGEETPDEEELDEEEKPEEPVKLKLVFPNGGGKTKEFCINLTPEEADSEETPRPKKK